ncbi:hypothetical protein CB1_000233030 [Camelus ferus]|nr:hypothetical protein CB1_000233030 [Camelus ferus]
MESYEEMNFQINLGAGTKLKEEVTKDAESKEKEELTPKPVGQSGRFIQRRIVQLSCLSTKRHDFCFPNPYRKRNGAGHQTQDTLCWQRKEQTVDTGKRNGADHQTRDTLCWQRKEQTVE